MNDQYLVNETYREDTNDRMKYIYINGKDQNTIIVKFGLSAETTAKENIFCGKQILELEDTTFDFRFNSATNLLYDFAYLNYPGLVFSSIN